MSSQAKARTVAEINQKICKGDAQVLTAEEMKKLVESSGVEVAFKEVDVVTTGTFGAMCSSGAVVNLGHSDLPIKIEHAWINDVEVCHPELQLTCSLVRPTCPRSYPMSIVGDTLSKTWWLEKKLN